MAVVVLIICYLIIGFGVYVMSFDENFCDLYQIDCDNWKRRSRILFKLLFIFFWPGVVSFGVGVLMCIAIKWMVKEIILIFK